MQTTLVAASIAALFLSGCCGGYSVVDTTVRNRAGVNADGEVGSGDASVLHYSRLGEPPNTCSVDAKFSENLWIQVPSLRPGETHAFGRPGVVVAYERMKGGVRIRAKSVSGKVSIKASTPGRVVAALDAAITLPSGEIVKLDDDYDFHPPRDKDRAPMPF